MLSVNRFILDDTITDTIRKFSLNHKECATLLLNTAHHFSTNYLTKHGHQVFESVVECIFAELFKLPQTKERSIYYNTLIIDLCKESLDKIPSVLGRSFKLLFSRLDGSDNASGMDVEAIKRFAEFFAIHLSNFGFSWKWSDWDHVLAQDATSSQFVFVRETLQVCIRLSYYDRIKNSVPESYEIHGSIFPMSAPTFTFQYVDGETAGNEGLFELVNVLSGKISSREDAEAIEMQLRAIGDYVESNGNLLEGTVLSHSLPSAAYIPHDALLQCIMFQGSKSFSHLLNVVESYLELLQKWNENEEARIVTTHVVCSYWAKNSQFLEIILGKLVNYRVIDSKSVISWALGRQNLEDNYDRLHVWSVLTSTVLKVNLKIDQLSSRMELLREQPGSENAMNGYLLY